MKRNLIIFILIGASLRLFGNAVADISEIQSHIAAIFPDYYSAQKISISYDQMTNDENKVSYYSKLFKIPVDAALKKYPAAKYDLSVELDLYDSVVFWKYSPLSDPSDYEVIMTSGKADIFYSNKGKYAVTDYLNYNTESSIAKITDYLCRIPEFSSMNPPCKWKSYESIIRDASNGKGSIKVLANSDDEIIVELSVPFQNGLPYFVVISFKKLNGVFVPFKYSQKSGYTDSAVSLWDINCEYDLNPTEIVFPKKVIVNYYHYLENGERCTVKTDVFSNVSARKIVLKKDEAFRPLTLPVGTLLRLGEKDQFGVIIGNAADILKNEIRE